MCKVKKDNKGFTLLELIIVIAIMSILIGVLAPTIMGYIGKAQRAIDGQTADEVKRAVDRILVFNGDATTQMVHPVTGQVTYMTACMWNSNSKVTDGDDMYSLIFNELGYMPLSRYDEDLFWVLGYTDELNYIYLVEYPGAKEGYELYPDPTEYINYNRKVKLPASVYGY